MQGTRVGDSNAFCIRDTSTVTPRDGVALNSVLELVQLQIGRRYRQFREIWLTKGIRGVTDRIRTAIAQRLLPKEIALPVDRGDVLAADLSQPLQVKIPEVMAGEPLVINWVMVPAEGKSGGHTTIFRMIRYLETHGYVNRVYFYNVYGGDHNYYKSIIRSFYGFDGPVSHLGHGMEDAHCVVATAWATAYPVFNSRCAGKRFYFAQDYEPYFHPVGAMSLLAENTYRMGFHAITAGKWLAKKLSAEFGMAADSFEFGCDTSVYHRVHNSERSGLVFYARPEAARRGYELGLMAMEAFAARRPDIDLHFYGDTMGNLPFRFINHGRVKPDKLNQIYNQCYAGLSLSLTNVSLVPHEMLAAGCIPVVNEAVQNRIVLDNSFVRYAPPYPQALASELEALVVTPDIDSLSAAAAASVRAATWDAAGATVDEIFRRVLRANTKQALPVTGLMHAIRQDEPTVLPISNRR
jgi:glycosyltransferase involved in cell wall biosynthesis